MVTTTNRTDGWQSYPQCLPDSFYDVDRDGQSRLLDLDAARLFSGHDDVEVWAYEQSAQGDFSYRVFSVLGINICEQ